MDSKKTKTIVNIVSIIMLEIALVVLVVYNRENINAIFQPIIIGLVIAYVIYPLMSLVEKGMLRLFDKASNIKRKVAKTISRVVSIFISLGVVMFIIVFIFAMLIPEIVESVSQLSATLPGLITNEIGDLADYLNVNDIYSEVINNLSNNIIQLISSMSTGATNIVISAVTTIKNVFLGFIIAAYVLYSNETLIYQSKKLVNAIFKKQSTADAIIDDVRETHKIFSSFFIGKILDSVIIGILCFISMVVLGMPYAVLVSIVIGVMNIIPFFGPFIGAVPSAILILLNDFWSGVYFVILIVVLQIIDGYVLEPKILGSTTGLSPLWVMVAIIVFGGLFGFIGMLFGVPILAVIFMLIRRFVNRRLEQKQEINQQI